MTHIEVKYVENGDRSVKQNPIEHAKLNKSIWTNGQFAKNHLPKILIGPEVNWTKHYVNRFQFPKFQLHNFFVEQIWTDQKVY